LPARYSEQLLDPQFAASRHTTAPISHTMGLFSVARKVIFISRPAEGRRLSSLEHAAVAQAEVTFVDAIKIT